MLTLSNKEFNKIYSKTSKAFTEAVYELYKKNKYAMDMCNDIQNVKELFVYLMALSSWEQAEYNSEYYYNCLNEEQIYNIYKQIKQIN